MGHPPSLRVTSFSSQCSSLSEEKNLPIVSLLAWYLRYPFSWKHNWEAGSICFPAWFSSNLIWFPQAWGRGVVLVYFIVGLVFPLGFSPPIRRVLVVFPYTPDVCVRPQLTMLLGWWWERRQAPPCGHEDLDTPAFLTPASHSWVPDIQREYVRISGAHSKMTLAGKKCLLSPHNMILQMNSLISFFCSWKVGICFWLHSLRCELSQN